MEAHYDVPTILTALEIPLGWTDSRQEMWTPCPLPFGNHRHGDQSPSFSVNLETGLYNCFVCGGGSLLQLVANVRGVTTTEARLWIENLFDTDLEEDEFRARLRDKLDRMEDDPHQPRKAFVKEELPSYEMEDDGELLYHPWLAEQGITEETAKKFTIFHEPERNSIIFPHYWLGKIVGWQERTLVPNAKPKYKNTPNFPKKNTLYNYDHVEGDEVIVVESPKTVAVLDSRGYTNVVATFGASVTQEQMQALWKFKKVWLWFDNDDAGEEGLQKSLKYLLDHVDILIIPPVNIEKGDAADIRPEETQGYIDRAVTYLRYKYEKVHNSGKR